MRNDFIVDYPDYTDLQDCIKNNFVIDYTEASFKRAFGGCGHGFGGCNGLGGFGG